MSDKKPVIFISYAHADEPEKPLDGEIKWLSFVQRYLQPAVKDGIFDLWVDRQLPGGADWNPEIEQKLRACDIFILLVSANSMASDYIIDKEIGLIRERQARGEDVHFYPLLLTPTPDAGLKKVQDKNLRPRGVQPFSGFSYHDRLRHMTEAANEIGNIAGQIVERKGTNKPISRGLAGHVDVAGLPETAYEKLRGRDDELKRLDDAWADSSTNILSLIAEGGAGKSALVNEWLTQVQADNYRGAKAVLGWSFYNQGTKERTTSSDEFLNWAIKKLSTITGMSSASASASASAKGEAIAEALSEHRLLLVLDGCEPLQHGLDRQHGELKDAGLRALLRRFASMPPSNVQGLVVLTSRLPIKDIARWKDSTAPVVSVEQLSQNAGAALLRDNGVWGADEELKAATRDFGGHPLAMGLLASFLKETQFGDLRRRDHIRAFFADIENPRHDHAKRVMESYEREWLKDRPIQRFFLRIFGRAYRPAGIETLVMRSIMQMVGLFDRPASDDCLRALRKKPAIRALTEAVVGITEDEWQRAIARLREGRLLAPPDLSAPDALDAHPLVREWFGDRLKQTSEAAWIAAHGRLYDHLRDVTKEGDLPTLDLLAPLYQAIAHGCRARRHSEARAEVYRDRICRRRAGGGLDYYAINALGAVSSDLAAISWFFDKPYETPLDGFNVADRGWLLNIAAMELRALGRVAEALPAIRASLKMAEDAEAWSNAAIGASNLSQVELLAGEISAAVASAKQSVAYADRANDGFHMESKRSTYAGALHAAGRHEESAAQFADAEQRQKARTPEYHFLYSLPGYWYCDLLISKGDYSTTRHRAKKNLEWEVESDSLAERAWVRLILGRAHLGLAISNFRSGSSPSVRDDVRAACNLVDEAIDGLRAAAQVEYISLGLLARATLRVSVGDWKGAARDLDEVEEIAEPGPMKLYLCDMALERARLAFARIDVFAPLNGLIEESPPKPVAPEADEPVRLKDEAAKQLSIASDYIKTCGYHRRDEELVELEAVLRGEKKFADLPPRV